MSSNDVDASIIKKYEQLKKRVHEMEQDNSEIHSKLVRAQKHVKRLRMERLILLEQLDEYYSSHKDHMDTSDSDDSDASALGSMMSDTRTKHHKKKRARYSDKPSGKKGSAAKAQDTPTPARKKKDPNAPKGPGNVFFLYCRMERENFKDELPTENLSEVTRLLGQKWKAMTDEEKKKYYDIYDREQEEYRRAMKSYKEAGGGDAGRIAVSEMSNAVKTEGYEEGHMMPDDEDDDEDDDEELEEGLEEDDEDGDDGDDDDEEGGSFIDDASVATTNVMDSTNHSVNDNVTNDTTLPVASTNQLPQVPDISMAEATGHLANTSSQ